MTASAPQITIPEPGSTLAGSTVFFEWIDNGTAVTEWWVWAGSTEGGSNYFDSGSLGTSLSTTVASPPTDGSTVYVRLWDRVAGVWEFSDFQYTAAGP